MDPLDSLDHDLRSVDQQTYRSAVRDLISRAVGGNTQASDMLGNFYYDCDELPAPPQPTLMTSFENVAFRLQLTLSDRIAEVSTDAQSPVRDGRDQELPQEGTPIDGYLALYSPDQRLVTYFNQSIDETAKRYDLSPDSIRGMVAFHEAAHAVVHLGRDEYGGQFSLHNFHQVDGGRRSVATP